MFHEHKLEHETLELMETVLRSLLERRDGEAVRVLLDDPVDWIGVDGEAYPCVSPLQQETFSSQRPWHVRNLALTPTAAGTEVCLVSGTVEVQREEEAEALRLSAVCRRTEKGLRVRQFHLSLSGGMETADRESETLLRRLLESQKMALAERDRNMSALVRNLPGGIVCCDNSPELNLIEYSDSFLDLFGYTREEVRELFYDQFSRMICPEDLEAVWPLVHKQLSEGNTKEIEYRVRRKDGSLIWLLDRGQLVEREDGTGYFYCILIDETETKRARQELQASLERYQIISAQTNDVIFEWDMETDQVRYSESWEQKFGYPPISCPPDAGEAWSVRTHPEDQETMLRLVKHIRSGMAYDEAEVRLADVEGRYIWCRVRITLQRLEGGSHRRAVGVIVDIDTAKRQTQKLRRLAEQDTLTGIYNKGTTQDLISQKLEKAQGEKGALFILDVDNFKWVNDFYGHLGGDAVLTDIARTLKELFRAGDIVGRIGGDEFCVYLSGIRDREAAAVKAETVLAMFHHILKQEDRAQFSCSVGIAVSPDDGEDYHTLFQKADTALYQAKEKGKNQFAFYDQSMGRKGLSSGAELKRERIDSERGEDFWGENLANYVFQVLYEAEDLGNAIGLLLEILGHQMAVSRVYIFEMEEDGRHMRNTYEWCADGVNAEIQNLQHLDIDGVRGNLMELERDGVFYCRDVSQIPDRDRSREILEAQGIRAVLHCAIRSGGALWGLVGFDECKEQRTWTRKQVDVLTLVTDIVGTFLIRYRAQERTEKLVQNLAAILDHQKAWIYVVAPDTHELLYTNHRTQDVLPGLTVGERCHVAFFGRETPCADCPLEHLAEDGSGGGRIYSQLLGKIVNARINTIIWEGERRACLISCLPLEEQEWESS